MTLSGWLTIFLFVALLTAIAAPLGRYMAAVYGGERTFLDPVLGRAERGLYREETTAVTFLTPTLFRTAIPLPAEVPIGAYAVEIKLFSAGHLLTQTDTSFEIVKVGFEQFVATSARQHGLAYGLVTAFMALMTGWMASIVFRKD